MFKDLLDYEGLDEACGEAFGFSNVTFLRDFGPIKKGTKSETVWFDLEQSIVSIQTFEGVEQNKFKFRLEA